MSNAKSTTLYDVLGVKPDASKEEIQRAYRKAAMREHPDRRGGSTEGFQKVQRAGDTLLDDEKRAAYDATGDETPANPAESLEARVRGMFADVVANGVLMGGEAFDEAWRKTLEEVRKVGATIKADIEKVESKLASFDAAAAKIKHSGEKHNTFAADIGAIVRDKLSLRLRQLQADNELVSGVIERAEQYTVEPPPLNPFGADYDSLEKRMMEAFRATQASTNRKSPFTNNFGSSYGPQR